jgi:hypothetical protein
MIEKETIAMRFKLALSIVAMICATATPMLAATPAFARYVHHDRPYHGRHYYHYRDYSGFMDPRSGHYDPEFQRNRENFGFSGRDPSRVGGEDPNLHPPGRM